MHECVKTVTPGGGFECSCGKSWRPIEKEQMMDEKQAPELSEVERARVQAFGLDKPEHDHDEGGCTCGCPVSDCAPCGGSDV